MKSILIIAVCSTLVGLLLGTAIAYYEFQPLKKNSMEIPSEAPVIEPSADTPQPKAVVPEEIFRFGNIEHRATMQHDFSIQNEGENDLVVTFGSSTCNCTAVELGGKVAEQGTSITIEPGEEATVMLEWTAKSSAGPYRHGATFVTNDPEMPRIELNIEGQVVESTAIRPSELLFGTVQTGETKEAHLYLLAYLDQPVEVLKYEVADEQMAKQIDVQIKTLAPDQLPDPDASGGVKVMATFRAGKSLGPFGGVLKLETSLENAKRLTVPIVGQVMGDISIYGPGWLAQKGLLRMGTIKSKLGKKVRLNVAVRGEHAQTTRFEVDRVDPPELKVTLGEPREMNEQLLHVPLFVEVPAGTRSIVRLGEPASTDAEIVLRSTHPDSSEVRLRVHFAVGQ
ncbi:MAG: DUF1573 domain-containing protein [Planctomycetes bacterium]|nr:DUF1573 domain-containing protein [Planctomycetota bacterium]